MSEVPVIVEFTHTKKLQSSADMAMSAPSAGLDTAVVPKVEGLRLDKKFPAVSIPKLKTRKHPKEDVFDTTADLMVLEDPKEAGYLVRGWMDQKAVDQLAKTSATSKSVAGIYADVAIQPAIICPGSPPLGTHLGVEKLLCVPDLHKHAVDGRGVMVAVVDTGINMEYLNGKGKHPSFDAGRSWAWDPTEVTPGQAPVDHGTMCAFDVCIAAPKCTLLDIALLHGLRYQPGKSLMDSMLSDAIRAYRHLINVMNAIRRPGENRSLVVSNSWGMFHPSWDWPVGHPGNYSDNPNHPFNRIVVTLERTGADILFAAGNCGRDCPDGRCQNFTDRPIYGANSSPSVTCVAGVDVRKRRVGYSSIGPGRLTKQKPDICGYTHFRGSEVYSADGGTSAACPVVAGVVAAVRSKIPFNPANPQSRPAAVRNLINSTAEDLGPMGYDYEYGHGVVNPCRVLEKLQPKPVPEKPWICIRYPWICDPKWWRDIFRRIRFPKPITKLSEEAEADTEPSETEAIPEALKSLVEQQEFLAYLQGILAQAVDTEISAEQMAYHIGQWLGDESEGSSESGDCGGSDT